MPSFLNKVFGYKKSDDKEGARPTREASDNTLLDGKYEAIPPVISPSSSTFPEAQLAKDSDVGFSLFKPKFRGASQKPFQKHSDATPHLTLQLPGLKESSDSRALGAVFEADPDSQTILDDAVIAEKRLSPLEALILIRACAQAITERGLETLGIMHPHWLSASPNVQRKLISLFIHSLTPQSRITTLSPTPTHPTSTFENELHFTRSPHDVAAVLRWGLRHLSLENGYFGKDRSEWAWYKTFFQAERNGSYPSKAFSELLLPQLPPSHVELLVATLKLVSSLASHAESNSISGSKLSKFLGVWVLVATRAEQSDDWDRFYARWERAGRVLEHLFLARLREEALGQRLPTRLQELVKYYPYSKGSLAMEDELLPRPRFSTRQYDALFVRVETLLMHNSEQPKQHPIQLLLEAFQLPIENLSGDEYLVLWNTLRTTVSEGAALPDSEGLQFTRILADETIQLLSSIPADNNVPMTPTLFTSPIKVVSRKRSSSLTKVLERMPASPTSPSSPVITDWAQFSMSGFGEAPTTQPLAALLNPDDDVEITQPRVSRKSSRHRGKSRSRRRRSEDQEPLGTSPSSQSKHEPSILETKLSSVHAIQLDEAFIDFWSDAIVDPISADWPMFIICGLKPIADAQPPIRWLVIEQVYSRQQPQRSRVPSPDGHRGRSPRPSFKSDISGFRINSMFSSARKRFSVFSKSATELDSRKSAGGKTPVTGELGEILVEEEPAHSSASVTQVAHRVDGNGAVRTIVNSGATTNIADQPVLGAAETACIASISPADPVSVPKEKSDSVGVAAKEPSVEPTPQAGERHDDLSVLPRPSVRPSEDVLSAEQGSPRTLDVVNSKIGTADPAAKIAPLGAGALDPLFVRDTSDPTDLSSGSALIAERPVTRVQIQPEEYRQDGSVGVGHAAADGNECLPAESNVAPADAANDGREVAEPVAMSPHPETVAVHLSTPPAGDEAPEHIAEKPRVVEQASRKVPIGFAAISTVESIGRREGDLPLVPAPDVQDKVIATETGAQLEPGSITPVVQEASEDTEFVEISTPALEESAVLVEETPSPESVDTCGDAGPTQDTAVEPETSDDSVLQPAAAELPAPVEAEEESVTHFVEEPLVETDPAVNASAHVVAAEPEHTAGQTPQPPTEEVQSPLYDADIPVAVAPLVGGLSVPEVEAYVPAAHDVTLAEVEAQAAPESLVSEDYAASTQGTGAPALVPEYSALVDGTSGLEAAAEVHEPVGADLLPVEVPSTESIQETAATVSATADETFPETKTELTPGVPAEGVKIHNSPPKSASIENVLEVAEANEPDELTLSTAADPEPVVDNATELDEEAQVHVDEAVLSAGQSVATPTVITEEPVAQEVQLLTESETSSETVPQIVDEAANPLHLAVPAPEEIGSANAEAQPEPEVAQPLINTVDGRQEVVEDAEPALAPEVGAPVEETLVVDVGDHGILSGESEPVEANAPVAEDVEAPKEAEEASPSAAGLADTVVETRPEAPATETDETREVEAVGLVEHPAKLEDDVSAHQEAELSEGAVTAEP